MSDYFELLAAVRKMRLIHGKSSLAKMRAKTTGNPIVDNASPEDIERAIAESIVPDDRTALRIGHLAQAWEASPDRE
jgi:hypothetical protein